MFPPLYDNIKDDVIGISDIYQQFLTYLEKQR
ncbi:hypothetical protein JAMGFMIE_04120 [Rheinheimera sp. MM224]|nr:hypothetical protein JAMGFMIE_04120 [Rheinheimera sp. MM224]